MSAKLTRNELLVLHNEVTAKAREIMKAKNHDYAHDEDVFRNFRRYGTLGVLVRLSDKLARLDSFEENNTFAVADEKLLDTVVDIINYAVIYYAMKQETTPDVPAKVVSIDRPKIDGPYCSYGCGNLADFENYVANRRVSAVIVPFACANCTCERDIDTSEWIVLEPCA